LITDLDILNLINEYSNKLGRSKYERDELTQTVSLIYLENPNLFTSANNLKNYIFIVVRNTYFTLGSDTCELVIDLEADQPEVNPIDRVKTFNGMLKQLPEIERLWISTYLDCEFNYSEIERRTGITRQCAKKRIDKILDRWKHLDIYLH
jgi:DNA-directed RNA polymerase specialized sigma24 family protein